jgi:hypothetical protein
MALPFIVSITAKAACKSPPPELIINCKYFGYGFTRFFEIINWITSLQVESLISSIKRNIPHSSTDGVCAVTFLSSFDIYELPSH